jgi:prepilin peptidase CpaA
MGTFSSVSVLLLVAILSAAAISDLRSRRIPNWLTFSAALLGVVLSTVTSGVHGLVSGVLGLLLGVAFLIVFYAFGGMGAGDVKLMGVVGSFLGPAGVFWAFVFTAIAGAIYSLALVLFHPAARTIRLAVVGTIMHYLHTRQLRYDKPINSERRPTLCYGVAIAIGTVASVLWMQGGL